VWELVPPLMTIKPLKPLFISVIACCAQQA
jgi:hypothetical protein